MLFSWPMRLYHLQKLKVTKMRRRFMHFKKCKETILTIPQIHMHIKTDKDNTFDRAINMQRTHLQNLVLEHKIDVMAH